MNEPRIITQLRCYQRLRDKRVEYVNEFAVPKLLDWDDEHRVIEMSIVQPPYLLDFGKAYVDSPPVYFEDAKIYETAYREWRERFGHQWIIVARALRTLEGYGIFYVDPRPSNVFTGVEVEDDDDLDQGRFFVMDES